MQDDLDRLQGHWTIGEVEVEGQKMSAAMLANASIAIAGNRFITTGMGGEYEGTLEINSSTSPAQLDMKFDAGPEKGNTNLCIYELNGDTWKLCIATRGTKRPSYFTSPLGSGFAVETLTRSAAPKVEKKEGAKKARKPSGKVTEFEGDWQMVSAIMNGQPMKPDEVQWVRRVTEGTQLTVYAGPQALMKMDFTNDASKSPKTIDYSNTAGPNKGKTQLGIYELKGNQLTVCVAPPKKKRPAQFQSTAENGNTLTVWKRT